MSNDTLLPFDLPSVRRKKLTVDFDGGNQSSDGGLLLLREAERQLGVCRRLAEAMPDRRDPDRIRHAMFEMVMARVAAIACGHEDGIDLDRLRHDPLMKIVVGRCPTTGAPLASQSTISRLENAPSKTEAARLCALAAPGEILATSMLCAVRAPSGAVKTLALAITAAACASAAAASTVIKLLYCLSNLAMRAR